MALCTHVVCWDALAEGFEGLNAQCGAGCWQLLQPAACTGQMYVGGMRCITHAACLAGLGGLPCGSGR